MDNANVIESPPMPAADLSLGAVLKIPAVRQIVTLIGVAAAVAAGFAIVLWSQTPGYTRLYDSMSPAETAEVGDALRAASIPFRTDGATGAILVPEASVHDARMRLASQGLPQSAASGISTITENSSFGASQMVENARYQHALEVELARTIASLGAVRDARVHLGIPTQTSFIRDTRKPTASVLVHLYRGRTLERDQAAAVVNLVASSVPELSPNNVTVIDQYGTLLSPGDEQSASAQANTQFQYVRRLEDDYKRRIEDLLTPLVGAGRVRAEVVADIDFTYLEETRESFDPERAVVRSEQSQEDLSTGDGFASGGVPGALTNQPPEAGGAAAAQGAAQDGEVQNTSRSSVRNYEIDRTISHRRPQSGTIRRLSVAVLIDNSPRVAAAPADGAAASDTAAAGPELTDEVLQRYTALVREAVGFSAARGDSVMVMGDAFLPAVAAAPIDEPAIWEQPMVRDILKQVLGALIVLAIAFGVVRPMLRSVVASSGPEPLSGEYLGSDPNFPMPSAAMAAGAERIPAPSFEEKVAAAKNITGHDPARVAQVVKKWVASDE